ncbi:uncharacterized protein LOC124669267 [Lolium rigidum]|uniref:uncharacterized protein LOC124669267 n=1 Tax=Lolium rigidum TaxID=89674 RepID=UPI001F5C4CE3|nr:uncharacterized protein LOC124669267 [Lolium rigidum]
MASNNVASEVNGAVTNLNDHLASGDEASGKTNTIITLAGENHGAAMEAADAEDLVVVEAGGGDHDGDDDGEDEEVEVSAYTNSNYQAVNNSVLVAGSCAVRDPGVHVVIVEHVDHIRDCEIFEDGEEVEK